MLCRVYDQLMILARFRHLNGNLKLAGLGDGIDLWGCAMVAYDTGWIRVMGLIDGDVSWGRATAAGWWNWFVGESHGGAWHWLDPGYGIDLCGRKMGAHDTGWIGAMGLIHGDVANDKVLYGCWI